MKKLLLSTVFLLTIFSLRAQCDSAAFCLGSKVYEKKINNRVFKTAPVAVPYKYNQDTFLFSEIKLFPLIKDSLKKILEGKCFFKIEKNSCIQSSNNQQKDTLTILSFYYSDPEEGYSMFTLGDLVICNDSQITGIFPNNFGITPAEGMYSETLNYLSYDDESKTWRIVNVSLEHVGIPPKPGDYLQAYTVYSWDKNTKNFYVSEKVESRDNSLLKRFGIKL